MFKKCVIYVLIFSILLIASCAHTNNVSQKNMDEKKYVPEIGDVVIIRLKDDSVIKLIIKKITDETIISKKYTIQKKDIESIQKDTGNLLTFLGVIVGAMAVGLVIGLAIGFKDFRAGG